MVFLADDTVPWSPMDIFRGSENIKANKALKIKAKFQLDGSSVVNMFEAPINSVSSFNSILCQYIFYCDRQKKLISSKSLVSV